MNTVTIPDSDGGSCLSWDLRVCGVNPRTFTGLDFFFLRVCFYNITIGYYGRLRNSLFQVDSNLSTI